MAPGGVEVIPLPEKKPHPGGTQNAKSPEDFAPSDPTGEIRAQEHRLRAEVEQGR